MNYEPGMNRLIYNKGHIFMTMSRIDKFQQGEELFRMCQYNLTQYFILAL